jgi:hypothetical protein
MTKLIYLIFTIAAMTAIATAPAGSTAASSEGSITGMGTGTFPRGASFSGVNLSGFEIATGVLTEGDGTAQGVLHAILTGRTFLGSTRMITLEGNVTRGSVAGGSGSFSGVCSLSFGDGIPAVSGVPFSVQTNGSSMILTIQSTVLPTSAFSQGGLDVE